MKHILFSRLVYVAICMILVACQTAITTTPALTSAPTAPGDYEIVATIPFPLPNPQFGTIGEHTIWYYNEDSGTVVALDTTTNQFADKIDIGDQAGTPYGNPKGMAAVDDQIWVTDVPHHAVVRVDPATNKIVDSISLEKLKLPDSPDSEESIDPFGLAIDGDSLWVTDFDKSMVFRVDIKSKQVVAVISHVRYPESVLSAFGAVWVIEHRDNKLVRIDPTTNTVVATIEFKGPSPHPPCGMCLDFVRTSADSLWVPLDYGGGVARVDPKTNAITATIDFKLPPIDLAIGNDGTIWTVAGVVAGCQNAGNFVARIDPMTNKIVNTLPLKCASSIVVNDGNLWVGTGDPIMKIPAAIVRIKPAP